MCRSLACINRFRYPNHIRFMSYKTLPPTIQPLSSVPTKSFMKNTFNQFQNLSCTDMIQSKPSINQEGYENESSLQSLHLKALINKHLIFIMRNKYSMIFGEIANDFNECAIISSILNNSPENYYEFGCSLESYNNGSLKCLQMIYYCYIVAMLNGHKQAIHKADHIYQLLKDKH